MKYQMIIEISVVVTSPWPLFSSPLRLLVRPPPGGLWDAAQRPSLSGLFTGRGPFPRPQPGWDRRGRGSR